MKTVYSILIAAAAVMTGCSKENNNNNPYYGEDYGPFKYTISGTQDTTIEQSGEANILLTFTKTSGPTENVSLEVTGVPENVTVSLEPTMAKPPFTALLRVVSKRAAIGNYPILITGRSTKTGNTVHNLNLNIKAYTNAAFLVEGVCTTSGACTPQTGALSHEANVVVATTAPNRVEIHGFWSDSWSNVVYADLKPADKTVAIPAQTVNGLTFEGNGTYTEGSMHINYTVKGPLVDEACNITYTRK
jgi:hypothetical protein